MRFFKNKSNVIFSILIFSQLIYPLIEISLVNINQTQNSSLNNVDLDYNFQNLIGANIKDLKNNLRDKVSIYDDALKVYISDIISKNKKISEKIEVIIYFKEFFTKSQRLKVIEDIFDDYEIKYIYDIISALALKVSVKNLIDNEDRISDLTYIELVSKSRRYTLPFIKDDNFQTNTLNDNNFPNWWISAAGADGLSYDGFGVKVAVIDTGIYRHPDLNVVNCTNCLANGEGQYDYNGHGTHCAGIIGSSGASSSGIYRGIAPGVSLIDAKAGNSTGGLLDSDIIDAIEWASKPTSSGGAGADIISMSFGASMFFDDKGIINAISNAKKSYGTIFVASAGNSGNDYYVGSSPAVGIDVISVGATNKDNNLASFSSWGPSLTYLGYPDIVAPGVNIISTSSPNSVIEKEKRYIGDFFDYSGNSDYIPLSGTSMSCPVVSGAIAIMKQAFPDLTAETARIALYKGAYRLPEEEGDEYLETGAGIINVSASLQYLTKINSTYGNVNNVTTLFPDVLPIEPFDLLHFPGDSQEFNLSLISGKANQISIEVPSNITGLSLSFDKKDFNFTNEGIDFTTFRVEIDQNIEPGERSFTINLTINGVVRETTDVSLYLRHPKKKILMESYHGLNDWLDPELSYSQIGFYKVMKDMAELNISIDYLMENWIQSYDKDRDNFIVTEERLSQYDLIVLQTPILPYSPLEINNLVTYFNNGGDLLYLGTRYQEVSSDNINDLFDALSVDIQVREENILFDEWLGIGATVYSTSANLVENHTISKNVDDFIWFYGHTFDITGNAESLAEISNSSVAAVYDGDSLNKGQFVSFGDLHWFYEYYEAESNNYTSKHQQLMVNLMEYFFEDDKISINIELSSERIASSFLNISAYLLDNSKNLPIDSLTLNSNLSAYIKNGAYFEEIQMSSSIKGLSSNTTYNLPSMNTDPYDIIINFTYGSKIYTKNVQVLYYDSSDVPHIDSLKTDLDDVNKGGSIELTADMDNSIYSDFNAYISLFSYSFYNMEKTINRTILLDNTILSTEYDKTLTLPNNPPGYGIYYVIPSYNGYITPNSPRKAFEINNYAPLIDEDDSYFQIGNSRTRFSDVIQDDSIIPQTATQGEVINFEIDVDDSGPFSTRDNDSQLLVSVNFFIAALSEPIGNTRSISLIPPETFIVSELIFDTDTHYGSITIPDAMLYNTIDGVKSRSTITGPPSNTADYVGILYINVIDSEGALIDDPFFIVVYVTARINWIPIIVIVVIVAAIVGIAALIYFMRRKKLRPEGEETQYYEEYAQWEVDDTTSSEAEKEASKPIEIDDIFFCPFCGNKIDSPKKFCPNCGKSLSFED